MIFLTRRERFNAAHRMFHPDWDDRKNTEVFGKCSNPNWHGHNYVLYVTVKGEVNPETGYLINFQDLSGIIKREVIDCLDHKNINIEVDFMQNIIPSSENLAIGIWKKLANPLFEIGADLHCIKVEETENNYIEYFGPK